MNWYKLALRQIVIPVKDYDDLMALIDKIARGGTDWNSEELQLQQNYPEAIEVVLKKKMQSKASCKCKNTCSL